jgi:hypothetical protein
VTNSEVGAVLSSQTPHLFRRDPVAAKASACGNYPGDGK